ncbi:MAG: 3-isopropylmalate dehydratase small subunit [Verrucomicrobiota bacterium]
MALEKISKIHGLGVHVMGDDIDTDRIIPARFMKCVTFDGLGDYAFYDVRKHEDGRDKDHILNDERYGDASILVSGANFGCGSSREHAPQSLYRFGFRGVLAESFAEIFFGNSITLGMPCMTLNRAGLFEISEMLEKDHQTPITLHVENLTVHAGDKVYDGHIPASARDGLIEGRWDAIAELLENEKGVDAVAEALPYV